MDKLNLFQLTSDPNTKTNILDAIAEVKKNLNYIKKFGLPASIGQHIDS